jgi:hypothetical protein
MPSVDSTSKCGGANTAAAGIVFKIRFRAVIDACGFKLRESLNKSHPIRPDIDAAAHITEMQALRRNNNYEANLT